MSDIQFKAPLTARELSVYTDLFTKLDTQGLGAVTAEHTIETLASASGIPKTTLNSIWKIVDTGEKRGQLRFKEFTALMRSVDRIEEHPSLPITSQLYEYPSLRPGSALGVKQSSSTPNSPSPPTATPGSPSPSPSNNSHNSSNITGSPVNISQQQQRLQTQIPVPAITLNDVSKYSQLFDRTTGQQQLLSGAKAREIFTKAKLSNTVLAEIWGLCDREANGTLDKQEFTVAMHLIGLCLSGHPSMNPVPKRLPHEVWDSVKSITSRFSFNGPGGSPTIFQRQSMVPSPPVSPRHVMTTPSSSTSTHLNVIMSPHSNRSSMATSHSQASPKVHPILLHPTNRGPPLPQPQLQPQPQIRKRTLSPAMDLSNQFFIPYRSTKDDWKIPSQKQAEFEKLFDSLNEKETERLDPSILVPFFMKSNLEREKLAVIWELCDVEKKSTGLSKAEFVVAMFLIQKFKAYGELPSELPSGLQSFITGARRSLKTVGNDTDAKPEKVSEQIEQRSAQENEESVAQVTKKLEALQAQETAKSENLKDLQIEHHSIVTKLTSLNNDIRSTAAKIESLESKIQSTLAANEELEQQLTIAEANYHANEAKLDELEESLRKASEENEKLNSDITKWESMTASLSLTLKTKQEEARVALSVVDNKKQQADASELTVEDLKKEIESMDKLVEMYIKKKAELDKFKDESTVNLKRQLSLPTGDDEVAAGQVPSSEPADYSDGCPSA